MTLFPVHTMDSAPAAAKDLLQQTQQNFGFVPNLIAVMASSPTITEAYLNVAEIFSRSGLSATEQQVVLLTVSHYHECRYCMAAHTAIASMQSVDADVVQAIREGHAITDSKLEALRQFTHLVVEKRGWLAEEEIQAFIEVGYNRSQMLDILVGVAQKTLSNFTNHLANTPLDAAFSEVAWQPAK